MCYLAYIITQFSSQEDMSVLSYEWYSSKSIPVPIISQTVLFWFQLYGRKRITLHWSEAATIYGHLLYITPIFKSVVRMRPHKTTHAQFNKPSLLYLDMVTLSSEMWRRTIEPHCIEHHRAVQRSIVFCSLFQRSKVDSTHSVHVQGILSGSRSNNGLEIWCKWTFIAGIVFTYWWEIWINKLDYTLVAVTMVTSFISH